MTTERTKEGLLRRAEEDERAKAYADLIRTPEGQREILELRNRLRGM